MDFLYDVAIAVIWGEKYFMSSDVAAAENEDDKIQGTYREQSEVGLRWSVHCFRNRRNTA